MTCANAFSCAVYAGMVCLCLLQLVVPAAWQQDLPTVSAVELLHADTRVIELADGITYEPHPVTGSAVWVAEIVTRETLQGTAVRRDRWTTDPHLPEALRAHESDYRTSGYDRGHLAAAANHGQPAAKDATFSLANAVPQVPAVNRGPMRWLEESLREKARGGDDLVIVTAPIYELSGAKEYAGRLPVPQAFVKAVLVLREGQPVAAHGYRIRNCTGAGIELVTIDAIEAALQRDLFHALPDEIETKLESGEE